MSQKDLADLIDRTALDLLGMGPERNVMGDRVDASCCEDGCRCLHGGKCPIHPDQYADWYKCPGCGSLVPPEAVFGGETGYAYRICCGCSYAKQLEFELQSARSDVAKLDAMVDCDPGDDEKKACGTCRGCLKVQLEEARRQRDYWKDVVDGRG